MKRLILPGAPYLPRHPATLKMVYESFLGATASDRTEEVFHLPPSCIGDYFPHSADAAALPEPFATDVKRRLQLKGVHYEEIPRAGTAMLRETLDVLLVRSLDAVDTMDSLLKALLNGVGIINRHRSARGKAIGGTFAADMDAGPARLSPESISSSILNVRFSEATIIGGDRPDGTSNWSHLVSRLELLRKEALITATEADVSRVCNCHAVTNYVVAIQPQQIL